MDKLGCIREVASRTGVNSNDVDTVVNEFLEVIGDVLSRDEIIDLGGFGDFSTDGKKPNKIVRFKTGSTLSSKVN